MKTVVRNCAAKDFDSDVAGKAKRARVMPKKGAGIALRAVAPAYFSAQLFVFHLQRLRMPARGAVERTKIVFRDGGGFDAREHHGHSALRTRRTVRLQLVDETGFALRHGNPRTLHSRASPD